ncbi:MAG: DoxX family protein [Actinomycetales bacterium]
MNIALWVIAAVLALAFLAAGAMKALKGKQGLQANPRMAWTADFSDGAIRAIGVVEILGAIGLILPALSGVAVILVPLAAVGLALAMLGAIIVHLRRGEREGAIAPAVLMILAIVVAWGRFGAYAF